MSLLHKNSRKRTEHNVRRFVLAWPALLGIAAALLSGCQTSPASFPDAAAPDFRAANYSTNILQEGDVVSVEFKSSTNFSTVQKISVDGTIILNSVGAVRAAGKTVEDLQAEVAKLPFKPPIRDDIITVKLVSPAASVYVSGAVVRPGKIPIDRPMTALEAIMEAGGWDPSRAKLSEVVVLRLEGGKQKKIKLNLNDTVQGRNPEPFFLRSFDIIYVPLKTFNY